MEVNNSSTPRFEDITQDKDGGVLKTIVKPGDGDEMPFTGAKIHVHYVGRLLDGTKFDSSRDRNSFFSFTAGKSEVIKGWDVAALTMRRNEICEIKVAPEYAYGPEGFPPKIPENATLIFEIELLGWEDENITDDDGVKKRIIKEGDGISKPNLDAKVKVHLRGTYQGVLFDERDEEFVIGDGYQQDIVEGIEKALLKMRRHERAKIYIKPEYGFKEEGHSDFGVPSDATIEYEVVLYSFEKALEIYEMNYDERLVKAQSLKDRALPLFKKGDFHKALEFYERIIKFVKVNKLDSDYPKGLPLKISAHSNMALCYLKLKDFLNVIHHCEKVISLDPNNIKAYFRLGESHIGSHDFENAMTAFQKVLELEPENSAAKKQLAYSKARIRQVLEKEKKLYSNIFAKMSN